MSWDSIWDVVWFFLAIFLWVAFFMLLFSIITDLIRSRDLGGVAKTVWAIVLIFLPFLGTFVYLIARGGGMADRSVAAVQHQQELTAEYVRSVSGGGGGDVAGQIEKAKQLLDNGAINQDEFDKLKAKALA